MNSINLVFPHQLFKDSPLFENKNPFYLVEEFLFFSQYKFHKQKLAFHRASMKAYKDYLQSRGNKVNYISATDKLHDIRKLIRYLVEEGIHEIHFIDPTDYWLEERIRKYSKDHGISIVEYQSPLFINSKDYNSSILKKDAKKYYQTKFYIAQRKRLNILIESENQPVGGKWSFDAENRKKFPRNKEVAVINSPENSEYYQESIKYVEKNFSDCPGELAEHPIYPINYDQSDRWLYQFLKERFADFGSYEDAIVAKEHFLQHSVLSPLINVGLLTPYEVIEKALAFEKEYQIPYNSTEGFIRQIIGWREFIRAVYEMRGVEERTCNYWKFNRRIPDSFYRGTTGIPPIDVTIKKVLKTGYAHHIERLMVLGNFMLLCEFDPDEVYRWFMELFIDAYDWVMVPNIYGMSQFADGGLFATKPYISSSNYLMKMSDYEKGDWQPIWDALFWRFMHVHRHLFSRNPRMRMLLSTFDKWPSKKRNLLINQAEAYLKKFS